MKNNDDRHVGKRENIWFPWEEHEQMLQGMKAISEKNKSNFIRSSVRNFVKAINEKKGIM